MRHGQRGRGDVRREQRLRAAPATRARPPGRQGVPAARQVRSRPDPRAFAAPARSPLYVPMLAARIAVTLVSTLVLAVAGYYWTYLGGFEDDIEAIEVLGIGAGGDQPGDGARDILLVGMDSRTDAKGNPLPRRLRNLLHAGSDNGELNTDTLILVHIPNDNSKAVAVSIPRDSYVELADGYGTHKINSAYGRAKTVERQRLLDAGVTDEVELETRSNAAGATLLRKTVENLTGRTIDNYASINLIGFYDITRAIGGIEVCLNNAVDEAKSGADFPAGRQTISGADALAFVRQRQDLPRGDLDRVVRQQVFMTGMARKILSAGTLTDPNKLRDLVDAVSRSVVINKDWKIMEFAQQMSGLTGGQIQFRTIPVGRLALPTPNDGVAVEVDPDEVRAFIGNVSGATPTETDDAGHADITANVLNSAGVDGLAATVADRLAQKGFTKGLVQNAEPRALSVIRHARGEAGHAQAVADALGVRIAVEPDSALPAGHVSLFLGSDFPSEGAQTPSGGGGQPQARQPGTEPIPTSEPPPGTEEPITADSEVPCVN